MHHLQYITFSVSPSVHHLRPNSAILVAASVIYLPDPPDRPISLNLNNLNNLSNLNNLDNLNNADNINNLIPIQINSGFVTDCNSFAALKHGNLAPNQEPALHQQFLDGLLHTSFNFCCSQPSQPVFSV